MQGASQDAINGTANTLWQLEEVRVWSRTKQTSAEFITNMKKEAGKRIARLVLVEQVEDAVRNADIITTTTLSRAPLVLNDWIKPGVHINCIGADAPGKQELDPAIVKRAKIVVDDLEEASQSGEINVPLAAGTLQPTDIWCSLGEIVSGRKQGRTNDEEVTIFVSTGLAVQSAVTANIAYKKAMAHGLGHMVELL